MKYVEVSRRTRHASKLPSGEEIHLRRIDRTISKKDRTYEAIGNQYKASRQAVYKAHKKWLNVQRKAGVPIDEELKDVPVDEELKDV